MNEIKQKYLDAAKLAGCGKEAFSALWKLPSDAGEIDVEISIADILPQIRPYLPTTQTNTLSVADTSATAATAACAKATKESRAERIEGGTQSLLAGGNSAPLGGASISIPPPSNDRGFTGTKITPPSHAEVTPPPSDISVSTTGGAQKGSKNRGGKNKKKKSEQLSVRFRMPIEIARHYRAVPPRGRSRLAALYVAAYEAGYNLSRLLALADKLAPLDMDLREALMRFRDHPDYEALAELVKSLQKLNRFFAMCRGENLPSTGEKKEGSES